LQHAYQLLLLLLLLLTLKDAVRPQNGCIN